MPLYSYQTIDSSGKKSTHLIESAHEQEVKDLLRRQGVVILSLKEHKRKFNFSKKTDLKKEALLTFTAQLSELLKASLPLYESLLSLEEQYRRESYHKVILTLCDQIKGGASLSKALSLFPKSFSAQYIAMVRAGEAIGALDRALDKLQALISKQIKLRKTITTALLYPALLFSFSCFTLLLLLTFVIPSIEMIFADRPCNMITRTVISVSHLLTQKWHYLIFTLFAKSAICFYIARQKQMRLWLHKQLLTLPLVRHFILESVLARFTRTLGSLLQGGVSMIEALKLSKNVMRSPILEKIIEEASTKIVAGSSLSKELKKSNLIPSLVPRLIAVGEESGTLPEMLIKVADIYEEEVEKRVTRLLSLAQPVILLVMGAIVGIIMLAVLLPLTDVNSFIGG